MRIFKNRYFHRWAKSMKLENRQLIKIVSELELNFYEASLGGGLYKKRIRFAGRGKSAGLRTIIAYKRADRVFFVYGFAKNDLENVTLRQFEALKKLANDYFKMNVSELDQLVIDKELYEVMI